MFTYGRRVNVYETDLMGIVHHSNHLKFCEEARVEWCKSKNYLLNKKTDGATTVSCLTVYETKVKYVLPLKYDDFFEVKMQAKVSGAKIIFQYKIFVESNLVCLAETTHCNLSSDLKVKRLDPHLKQIIERELWTETWL